MKSLYIALLLTIGISSSICAQTDGLYHWKVLSNLTFASKYNAETGDIISQPVYGDNVKALNGKTVYLKGYIMPVPSRDGTLILSAFPFTSCYYCGQAGPESVVEVRPKSPILARGNRPVVIRGRLSLNEPYDMLLLPYFMVDAELISQE